MCIIAVSPKGIRQPDEATIRRMFYANPHGAGYMYARDGRVHIHKGFMDVHTYVDALREENFTDEDAVVYHFRISTQAGVNPAMTHPFPLSDKGQNLTALDVKCRCGIAHNGIIRLTTDPTERTYSDTALFIAQYLTVIIRNPNDLRDEKVLSVIESLAQSKFAIMDGSGYIATIGNFITSEDGIMYSNTSYAAPVKHTYRRVEKRTHPYASAYADTYLYDYAN